MSAVTGQLDTNASSAATPASGEVAPTLAGPTPKTLSFVDQAAFWANLGVTLLGFSAAGYVLAPANAPRLSIVAAIVATIVGTVLGSVMVGLAAVPGAQTDAPAMVVLRGLFGGRLSALPTVVNILQLIGWGTFELLVIAQAAQALFHGGPHWLYVVITGVITTAMTIWPLGAVRVLRRYVTVAMIIAMIYLSVQVFRHPVADLTTGSWRGFWAGSDVALAVAVSWIPVASDYSRHSRRVAVDLRRGAGQRETERHGSARAYETGTEGELKSRARRADRRAPLMPRACRATRMPAGLGDRSRAEAAREGPRAAVRARWSNPPSAARRARPALCRASRSPAVRRARSGA